MPKEDFQLKNLLDSSPAHAARWPTNKHNAKHPKCVVRKRDFRLRFMFNIENGQIRCHREKDEKWKGMKIIIDQEIHGISLDDFCKFWSVEQVLTSNESLLLPLHLPYPMWLKSTGKLNVVVSAWHPSNPSLLSLERKMSFSFVRTTHLFLGPPIASVEQRQCFHKTIGWNTTTTNGNDETVQKVVTLSIHIKTSGIPFADCFQVHIRWVVTQVPPRKTGVSILHIQVGLSVEFLKFTIFADQIRSGATQESTKAQKSLFHAIEEYAKSGSAS